MFDGKTQNVHFKDEIKMQNFRIQKKKFRAVDANKSMMKSTISLFKSHLVLHTIATSC